MSAYDAGIAAHYAAYRPPLHLPILQEAFGAQRFQRGLDYGSGTGQSSLALKHFCQEVVGLEPSLTMRKAALPKTGVQYASLPPFPLPFPAAHFDCVSFAGSLFYARSQELIEELDRICTREVQIVIYDFDLDLGDVEQALSLSPLVIDGQYDHTVDLEGLTHPWTQKTQAENQRYLVVSPTEIAHLLLADPLRNAQLGDYPNTRRLREMLQQRVGFSLTIPVRTWVSLYMR